MAKVKQSKQELTRHLQENLGFLKASAASFDAGFFSEAKRLAVTIRVLVHDSDKSKSLLGLLGIKTGMGFLDTAHQYDPRNLMSHHGLVGLQLGAGGNRYFAPLNQSILGGPNKYVFFPDWWNKVVVADSKKSKFNRRELVLALANKDGGAHVDPTLDERYADLTRNNSVGWLVSDGSNQKPLNDVELHSVRQIAHEIILSVERKISKFQTV